MRTRQFVPYLKFTFLFIFVVGQLSAIAQKKSFSRKPEVFIEELGEFMKSSGLPSAKDAYQNLNDRWKDNKFNEEQQILMINTCNYMLIKKMNISPGFENYLNTLYVGTDSTVSSELFTKWMKASYPILKKSVKSFRQLLDVSYLLFKDNILYQSPSKTWTTANKDFDFQFKDNKIIITTGNTTLKCKAKDDFINIYNTQGYYLVDEQIWFGQKGVITWERVKLNPRAVYAELGENYKLRLNEATIKLDTVRFHNTEYLEQPLLGSFEDRVSQERLSPDNPDFADAEYPRFKSFRKDLLLAEFAEGKAKLKGGFGMNGAQLTGTGDADNKATFEFYYKEKLMISAKSQSFSIRKGIARSLKTDVTIFTDSGEIYHPMLSFNYLIDDNKLVMSRGDEGIQRAPFFDSERQLEFYVDEVVWKLEEDRLFFDMRNDESPATFESAAFYKEFAYERVQAQGGYHPLTKLQKYAIQTRQREFTLSTYAQAIGSKKENLIAQIIRLADGGFIYYDPETELMRVKPKTFHYVNSHFKFTDYDVIRLNSIISARSNAELNLINGNFTIEGVRSFRFSDSQMVAIYPHEQQVVMKRGRDMEFGGVLRAGRFDFSATDWKFSYDGFYVTSPHIDWMKIYYPDSTGQYLLPIRSLIRDINGTLYIDKGNNKSGLQEFPEYPIFETKSHSRITYDKEETHEGIYDPKRFGFKIDPFVIDSLDNFTVAGLSFPGTFESDGILPEFRHAVRIMDDYSLGFEKTGQFPLYRGKGQGDIHVKLSNEGLYADGDVKYEGAEMKTSKMLLMLDSARADVESYTIAESTKYPNMKARDVENLWIPGKDSMIINTKGHTVDIFRDNQKFNGDLVHTPDNLSGDGVLSWELARLTSTSMKFETNRTKAAVSKIEIGNIAEESIAFATDNVKSDVDFDTRIGEFTANQLGNITDFPLNMFASTHDQFKWDMDAETIDLIRTSRLPKEDCIFMSKHPDQDGLSFQSPKATFDMKTNTLFAEEVPYIDIADSRVFPFEGKVTINEGAVITPLKKAELLAGRDNKYHKLFACELSIGGRLNMEGAGSYYYKDKQDTKQEIYFHEIKTTRDSQIVALGKIKDSINFIVSPKIQFKGNVELNSIHKDIAFNGYVKPLHTFEYPISSFTRYQDRPDPYNLIVKMGKPKDENNSALQVGMHIASHDSVYIYPTFFSRKRVYRDLDLTIDTGVFFYDESAQTFFMGNEDRLLHNGLRGQVLSFDEGSKTVKTDGKLDLGLNFDEEYNESFDVISAGSVIRKSNDSSYSMDAMLGIDMVMPPEAWERVKSVFLNAGNTAPLVYADQEDAFKIAQYVDGKSYDKIVQKINDIGEIDVSQDKNINRDLLITRSNFYVRPTYQDVISSGKIIIATIQGEQINKEYEAKMEISHKRTGARITMYIEASPYDWFYFDFYRGNLYVRSSDKDFNNAILNGGASVSKKGYSVRLASPRTATRFTAGFPR